jgi:two-component system sensor histidine kinase RpfC
MAPMYIVMMWVTIGNGLRYGARYLLIASVVATATFTAVVLASPFWHTIPFLSGGLALGLLVIPAYLQSLLRALTKATDEARRSSAAKSLFLANMSHELRTPLNGITGMTQLLATTSLSPEQREYTDVVRTSANTLLTLVDDVLDIASIEAGKLKVSTCDFSPGELLDAVRVMLAPQAESKGLAFEVVLAKGLPERVHGDRAHLHQILVNLANNAIKFTERGHVVLMLRPGRLNDKDSRIDPGHWVTFTVSDTGIGIPAEARSRIFNAFEQVDNERTRKYGGTGLGTAIAKNLAKAMGGDLDFESSPGNGTSFYVEVPLPAALSDASSTTSPERSGMPISALHDPFRKHRSLVKPQRVLVGDDHATNRMVLRRLLEKAGHTVIEAEGGEQVLERLADETFDLVLVDLHMPGTSGLEVLREARVQQAGPGPRTPIVVVSADVTPQAMQAAAEAGARAFLPKPVVATRLLQTLAEVVSNAKAVPDLPTFPAPHQLATFNPEALEQLREPGLGNVFLEGFVTQSRADLDAQVFLLRRAIAGEDWRRWRELCHAVKGLAGALGLERASKLAHDAMMLEPKVLAADAASLERRLLAEVKAGYDELGAYAKAHFSTESA